MKIPIISLAILGGQAALAASVDKNPLGFMNQIASFYTGYDFLGKQFVPGNLAIGYAPWIVKRFVLPIARPRLGGMHLPISIS